MVPQRYRHSALSPLPVLKNAASKQIHNLRLHWDLLCYRQFPSPYTDELLHHRLVQWGARSLLPRQLQGLCLYHLRLYSVGEHFTRYPSIPNWRKEYFRRTPGKLLLDLDVVYFPGRHLTPCEQGITMSYVQHRHYVGSNKQGSSGYDLFPGDSTCDSQIQAYISYV